MRFEYKSSKKKKTDKKKTSHVVVKPRYAQRLKKQTSSLTKNDSALSSNAWILFVMTFAFYSFIFFPSVNHFSGRKSCSGFPNIKDGFG